MSKRKIRRRVKSSTTESLTPAQLHEFLRVVYDDLAFLKRQERREPSRTDVRVAAVILRRLLHEGILASAWQKLTLKGEPHFEAIDLAAVLEEVPPRYVNYAYAGGADTAGAQHLGMALLVVPREEAQSEGYEEVAQRVGRLLHPGRKRTFSLKEFCDSPAVISGGVTVSRLGVVRYVANKLGGVHWDAKREVWSDPVGSRHRFLDDAHLMVGPLPGPLYEVVSIAHAVADSKDTARLLEEIDRSAPETERSRQILSFREGRIGKYADMRFASPSPVGVFAESPLPAPDGAA